jgi:RNA polymerase primary sigma factor
MARFLLVYRQRPKEVLMTAIKESKTKKTVKTSSDENVLTMYLREVGRIPLLSREEEDQAARAAAAGDMTARSKLVNGNLRFVITVAKKYQDMGLPLEDLIGEGNAGLIMAVDHYDVDKGYHFISYAVWWIRQTILKALNDKARMIRLPQNRANELLRIERARRILQEQQSDKREIEEIAGLLEMETELVEDLLNISRDMVSLDLPVFDDQKSSILGDFLPDEQ